MSQRENTRDTEESPECPTCGREDFSSIQGMRIHHALAHGESLVEETVVCDYCGDGVTRHPRYNDKGERNFCDEQCFGNWASENRSGENHPQYKGAKKPVECDNCQKQFEKYKRKIKRSKRNYCSPECASEHRSEIYIGENHPNYNRSVVECNWCGNEISKIESQIERYEHHFCDSICMGKWESENQVGENHPNYEREFPTGEEHFNYKKIEVVCQNCKACLKRSPSRVKKYDKQFCDSDCQAEWYSENIHGENHPSYIGGHAVYGSGWNNNKKEKIRARDNHECQDCGISSDSHKEKYGANLHVHHIIKARRFENDKKAHRPNNLITLCNKCHQKWEKIEGLKPSSL